VSSTLTVPNLGLKMQKEDWIKLLKDDKQEDWEWYARWLQDEENNEIGANVVKYILKEVKQPENSKNYYGEYFYYWYRETIGSMTNLVGPPYIEDDVFNNLKSEDRYSNGWAVRYKTVLEAKLDLINAREKFLRK
jgi:hypothetical protein